MSCDWLLGHLDSPDVRVVQVDDDGLAFEVGHVPGAAFLCWHADLGSRASRDLLDAVGFADLMDRLGIAFDTTVVLYGDQMNLWAAYAWWVMRLWGHPDVRLLDGGYAAWARAGLPMVGGAPGAGPPVPSGAGPLAPSRRDSSDPAGLPHLAYPVPREPRRGLRAFRADVERALATGEVTVVDVRSPAGYQGEVVLGGLTPPLIGAIRGGHIPGALSLPWVSLLDPETGLLLGLDELRRSSVAAGVRFDRPVIVYCELGASSGLVCLVLGEILGHPSVANYDGSWLEWAAAIGAPVSTV
ncbi:MAG: sulfurtransferase [Acidimicrobiales bacterium]